MSKQLWHFVDPLTGIGTGLSVYDTAEAVERNLPSGLAVWCSPSFDHLAERVDWDQHCAVPYQPPPPPDTELATWTWNPQTLRWETAPTLRLLRVQAGQQVLAQLTELDGKLARPAGEVVLAQALGQAVPSAPVQRLQAIEVDKTALRARLAAINAAESAEALAAVVAEPVPLQTSVP